MSDYDRKQLDQGLKFLTAKVEAALSEGYSARIGVDAKSPYITVDGPSHKQTVLRLCEEDVEDCHDTVSLTNSHKSAYADVVRQAAIQIHSQPDGARTAAEVLICKNVAQAAEKAARWNMISDDLIMSIADTPYSLCLTHVIEADGNVYHQVAVVEAGKRKLTHAGGRINDVQSQFLPFVLKSLNERLASLRCS